MSIINKSFLYFSAVQMLVLAVVLFVWLGQACPYYPTTTAAGQSSTLQLQCKYGTGFTGGGFLFAAIVLAFVAVFFPNIQLASSVPSAPPYFRG